MKKDKQDSSGFSILMDFSHEIRNPLNGISGMTNILLDTSLNADQKSIVNNIKKQSQGLNQILELMLDYSKISNGMISNNPEQVFIYPFLQKSLDAVFKTYKKKRKKFCYFIPPQLSGIAIFDPHILSQIIILSSKELSEADHHYKTNLEIKLEENQLVLQYHFLSEETQNSEKEDLHQSHIAQLLNHKYLEMIGGSCTEDIDSNTKLISYKIPIKCSPLKKGMVEEKEDSILNNKSLLFFNYQSDACESTSRYLQYLGMKLFKSEKNLNQYTSSKIDGQYQIIGIDISHMNKHEFHIMDDIRSISELPIIMFKESDKADQKVLPLQKDVVVMYKPVSPNNLSHVLESVIESKADQLRDWIKNPISVLADYHNSLKILIADDESINQRVLREYLNKLHLKADFVKNGKKALELYETHQYDLILMDIQMPEMNGVEAAQTIRAIKNGHHPYIVAITADALKGGKQKYLDAGMNDYLLKPVSLEGVTKIIQKYIHYIKH